MDIAVSLGALIVGLILGGIAVSALRGREITRLSGLLDTKEQQLSAAAESALEQGRLAEKAARVGELEAAAERSQAEINRLTGELKAAEAQAKEQASTAAKQIAALTDVRGSMLSDFRAIAAETMKVHGESVAKQNVEQIATVLSPLRDKITEFQQNLQSTHTESIKERATLAEQIRTLTEASGRMSQETQNLTRALKGDVKTQGAWGEMILASVFERCGLRKGYEYVTQQSHATEDGNQIRPDAVVNLPLEHCIVVDAKVSLTAFERYVNATSDEEKERHLAQHVASIRSHIEKLSNKEYWRIEGSHVDYVVMFIPIEPALAAALQYDPELVAAAVERGVAIATPTTLMIALRTVANVWRVERQNRNAQDIADRAGRLYDKFVGFVGDMQALGGRIDAAKDSFLGAMNKLSSGQGNLVRQVEILREMGATTKKALPKELVGDITVPILAPPDEGPTAGLSADA